MKRHIIAAILLPSALFFSQKTSAQKTLGNISLSAGYSLPVGKFAKTSPGDPLAGLAGSGVNGQLSYERPIWKWLGIQVSGNLNNNSTNTGPIIEKANSWTASNNKVYRWQSDVSKWTFGAVLFGPAVYKNFGKLLVQGHLQAGIVWARTASVHLTGNVYDATGQVDPVSPTINVSLERQAVNQFGLGGGINLRYPLSNHFFIQAYSDVLAAKAQVKNLAVKAKIGTLELSEQISDKRFIGVVNLGGGIGISF